MAKINQFSFGLIVVDNKKYRRDVLIFPDGKVEYRKGGIWMFGSHKIKKGEIERLVTCSPETVIIGTGTDDVVRLDTEAEDFVRKRKIELTVLPSQQAVDRINELTARSKKVASLIHITC